LVSAGHEVLLYTTGDSTCPVPKDWVFDTARGVGSGGSSAEARHVLAAYEAVAGFGFDIVHDHTLIGPLYAHRFPGLAAVTTNHGPFLSDLGPLYRQVSARVPVIAISHLKPPPPPASTWPESSTTASTWTASRPGPARAATPCSSAGCTPTRECMSPPGSPRPPGSR
jgi:hypothetical protein